MGTDESTLENKFQRVVTLYKNVGLNASLHKCVMKVTQKSQGMEKINCKS
jgi:hypothetical protein